MLKNQRKIDTFKDGSNKCYIGPVLLNFCCDYNESLLQEEVRGKARELSKGCFWQCTLHWVMSGFSS